VVPGLPWSGDERGDAGGRIRDRIGLAIDDDGRLGAELREVTPQLVSHGLCGRTLRFPSRA
jgi:hypothetical protein